MLEKTEFEKWKQLGKGLNLPEPSKRKGTIPSELVEKLDLVYCLGDDRGEKSKYFGINLQVSRLEINNLLIDIRKILTPTGSSFVEVTIGDYCSAVYQFPYRSQIITKIDDDKTLKQLFIFGAVLTPSCTLEDFAVTPVFCLDKMPEGIPINEETPDEMCVTYQGLYPVGISNGYIQLQRNEWAGRIDVIPSGKASVYFGNAVDPSTAEAVLFDKLVPFDLEKRLILARSPNGSANFDDVLHKTELSEGKQMFEYALIYDCPARLTAGKTYAVYGKKGLHWENNTLLYLSTREEK